MGVSGDSKGLSQTYMYPFSPQILSHSDHITLSRIPCYTAWQHFLPKKKMVCLSLQENIERICCWWCKFWAEVKMTVLQTWTPPLRAWKLPSTKRLTQLDRWVILHDFIVLYNEMCQHLEDMHNLVNQYFPNDQCMML